MSELATDKVARAKEATAEILKRLSVKAEVEAREDEEGIALSVNVQSGGEGLGIRPGARNPLLEALQHLVNKIVNRSADDRKWVTIDVGGFRQAEDPEVAAMAKGLAEKARALRKPIWITHMSSRDRRTVHLALQEMRGIRTFSEGEGAERALCIVAEGV